MSNDVVSPAPEDTPEVFDKMVTALEYLKPLSVRDLIGLLEDITDGQRMDIDPTFTLTALFDRGGLYELIARYPQQKDAFIDQYNQYCEVKRIAKQYLAEQGEPE